MRGHRRIQRRYFVRTIAGVGALAASPARTSAADNYTLRCSIPLGVESSEFTGCVQFAKAAERRTGGRLKIEIYPNGTLANQTGSISGLTSGVVDLTIQSSVFFEPLFPRLQVLDLPFLFKDARAVRRVLESSIGRELLADMSDKGIHGLSWHPGGFREFETVSKSITKLGDLKGMRIRIQNAPISLAMVQALGAIPIVIDYSETYTALQQHTVDGLETSLEPVAAAKLDNVIKFVAMTNHVFSVDLFVGSKDKLDALPREFQHILDEEAKAAFALWWDMGNAGTNAAIKAFKAKGIAFTDVDHTAFRSAMDPLYSTFQVKLGRDFIERISRAAG